MDKEQYDIVKGAIDENSRRIGVALLNWAKDNAFYGDNYGDVEWNAMNNITEAESAYNQFLEYLKETQCKNVNQDVSVNSIQ